MSDGYVTKRIKLGIYPLAIDLVIAINLDKANAYFQKKYYFPDEAYPTVTEKTGLCRRTGSMTAILVPRNANTEVVTHECLHAICFVLDHMGINYGDAKNTEVICYPLGYLCRAVFNEMHEWRDKK